MLAALVDQWEWGLKTNKGVNEERLAIHFARVRTIRPKWFCTLPNVLWLNFGAKNCHPATPLVVRLMRNQNLILAGCPMSVVVIIDLAKTLGYLGGYGGGALSTPAHA